MLQDSRAAILLTQERLRPQLPMADARTVCLDAEWSTIATESANPVEVTTDAGDLAYVIYTSGSTGQPKGAMNAHRGIVNRLLWMQAAYGLGRRRSRAAEDAVQLRRVGVGVLLAAAGRRTLVIARPDGHRDPAYLRQTIAEQRITTLHFVPSMLKAFLDEAEPSGAAGRCAGCICSGEALLSGDLRSLLRSALAGADCTTSTARPRPRSTSPPGSARRAIAAGSCRSAAQSPTSGSTSLDARRSSRSRSACAASCTSAACRSGAATSGRPGAHGGAVRRRTRSSARTRAPASTAPATWRAGCRTARSSTSAAPTTR